MQRRGHHVPVREAHGRNMIAEAACSRSSLSEKAGAAGLFRQDTFSLRLGARPGKRAGKPCCARLPNPPRMSPGSDCIWRASALQASPKGFSAEKNNASPSPAASCAAGASPNATRLTRACGRTDVSGRLIPWRRLKRPKTPQNWYKLTNISVWGWPNACHVLETGV